MKLVKFKIYLFIVRGRVNIKLQNWSFSCKKKKLESICFTFKSQSENSHNEKFGRIQIWS